MIGWTDDPSERVMLAFSLVSNTQLLLPAANDNTSLLHIVAYIHDTFDCVTEFNMSSVLVEPDLTGINNWENSTNNTYVQMLAGGNQNTVTQILTSVSRQFNKINTQAVETAMASKYIHHNFCIL